jgi:hypothetical protein
LGAWARDRGDHCRIFYGCLPDAGEYDEIWITTRFTYDVPFAVSMVRKALTLADRVWVGGISATLLPHYFEREGADVHLGLLPEAEEYPPDYSLLRRKPEYSITHTSRGCVRRCKFCMVPRLETRFEHRSDWEKDLDPRSGKVLFYDNNWLAKAPADLDEDISKMRDMVHTGQIEEMDFNQALDARLLTEEIADKLVGLPIKPFRLAFDGPQEDGHLQTAVRLMVDRGFKLFTVFTLYNFVDTPQDLYYRLEECVKLNDELPAQVYSFPMRYQPILDVDGGRDFVGKHWTTHKKKGFMTILNKQGMSGQISVTPEEFRYWFGSSPDEFDRLLGYPKIHELMRKRKGALRFERAT